MGLKLLSFFRDWTNPADFPTVEPDEATVRADLQYHPDAIKDYINGTLIPSHDALTDAKHSHNNKTVLDGITADDVAKLAQEPLYGTTLTLTPTQVYDAVSAGIPVKVQYFDGTYGSLSFTVFNAKSSNVIVSQRIISANGEYILAELIGNKPNGTWNFVTTTLAEKTDIPSLEGYATEAYVQNYHDNTKQDIITDLATIRSGASKGATAVQPEAGKGLFSGSYNDLTDKPAIPDTVTEGTVSGWGFTKNTGTYSKPAGGIPKSDLAAAVQTSLGKADTALQEHQSLAAYRTAAAQDAIDAQKQSIITDLETIRSGAARGATAVQPESGKGLFSGSYNDLTDKPTIPDISGKQDKLIAGEGITIAADGKTISSSGKVSSVNGKTGAVTLNAEDIIYAKESQKLDATIIGLKAADVQMASDISELQTADASLDSRITAIETGDTPVTLYIYWESVVGAGRVSLTKNGAAMPVADFISKMQSGAKITIGENNDTDSESSGFTNYRYKITDSTTASLAFDVANSFNGSNRTIIISGSSSTDGLMHGYQDIGHDDLSDYSPLPEGSTPASKAWVENYVAEKAAALQSKSITDTGGYFTTDTVEGALQEIGAELAGINTLLGSGIQISFTIDGETFSAVSGETWKEWVGTSRVISETSGLTLYCFSDDGIIFADEAGVNALGLNDVWVHGNETIVSGATYAIIPCGG